MKSLTNRVHTYTTFPLSWCFYYLIRRKEKLKKESILRHSGLQEKKEINELVNELNKVLFSTFSGLVVGGDTNLHTDISNLGYSFWLALNLGVSSHPLDIFPHSMRIEEHIFVTAFIVVQKAPLIKEQLTRHAQSEVVQYIRWSIIEHYSLIVSSTNCMFRKTYNRFSHIINSGRKPLLLAF